MQVVMAYTVAMAVFIFAFWHSPDIAWVQWLAVAAVGAALYGPQMLIGLCGAEAVSKSAVSAAQGFLGCAFCLRQGRRVLATAGWVLASDASWTRVGLEPTGSR